MSPFCSYVTIHEVLEVKTCPTFKYYFIICKVFRPLYDRNLIT